MPLISMKVPDDVLARIDAEAEARNMSRTALLLLPFRIGFLVTATAPLPDIEMNGYGRRTMGHALTCKCLICKPPTTR